jgi:molecular chaperone DnaJ
MVDPHEILGVAPAASAEALHRAFKKAVRRHHPDLNPGDAQAAQRLRSVVDAYQSILAARARKSAPTEASTVAISCRLRGGDLLGTLSLQRARPPEGSWVLVELHALDACVVCRGSGWEEVAGSWGRVDRWECEACRGGGILRVRRKVKIHVPARPPAGAKLRLRGVGLPRPGLARGDAILDLAFR